MQLSTEIKNARLQVVAAAIDAGSATLQLLSAESAVICELLFAVPCAADISNGTLTFDALPEALVLLNEDINSAAIVDDADNVLITVTVGDLDSSCDLKLPSLTVYQGSLLRLSGWTISEL